MKISGIYQIQSKIKPFRIYIGSSKYISQRWHYHLLDLRKGKHHSQKLQRHYDKYGESDLVFSILLSCPKDDLIKIEQYFFDSYKPYFNNSLTAGSNLGLKRSKPSWNKGKKATPEMRAILSKAHKGQEAWNKGIKTGQPAWNTGLKGVVTFKMPEESKKKISKCQMGNKNALGYRHNEISKQKMRDNALGRMMSEETRNKLRITSLGNKNMLGKKRSEETKKRVSEGLKKYFASKRLNKLNLITNN